MGQPNKSETLINLPSVFMLFLEKWHLIRIFTSMRGYSNNFHRVSLEILLNSAQPIASYVYLTGQSEALKHPLLKLKSSIKKTFQVIMAESKICFVNPKVSKNSINQHYNSKTPLGWRRGEATYLQ